MNTPEIKQKYADKIRQLIPINELPQDVQNQVIQKAELIEAKKKDLVFNQGERDNFSYYLLEGEIELEANKQVHNSIVGTTDRARYPMAQLQPRQFTGKAKVNSVVIRLNRDALDKMLVMHPGKNDSDDGLGESAGVVELDQIDGVDDEGDWMTRMLQSEIFSGMPTANIHQLFSLLEPIEYKAGALVIEQGEPGNHYYIIQEGRCEVLRQSQPGGKDIRLAELRAGDSFGEEALIAETTRNATIRMLTDGVVAQLSKDSFVTLIQKPVLKAVSSQRAAEIVKAGGKWLDVRFKNEHDRSTIEGCEHIPMNILRMKLDNLSRETHYVLFCDTGGRSSTAAFLLTDRGYTASYLDSGLMNHPDLAPPEDVTQAPKIPAAVPVPPAAVAKPAAAPKSGPKSEPKVVEARTQAEAAPRSEPHPQVKPQTTQDAKAETSPPPKLEPQGGIKPQPQPVQAAAPAPITDPHRDEDMDPEIMATVLEAELTRTNFQIERAKQQDQTEQKNIETAKRLEQERAKIEEAKKRVEEDVIRLRQQEEAKLKKLEQEAELRMQQERNKLEEVYSRNAEEMEKLEKLKQETEDKLNLERQRLEQEAEEAKKNRQDVEKLRQELEAARKLMEDDARKRQLEQEEMRKHIELQARKKIEIERRKLAEQMTRNNQEMEKARQEKAVAEAGRAAAKQEAELMIQEYKSQHEKTRSDDEARLKAERMKLEEEQKKIQLVLQDIQRTRAEAEALKRSALAEVTGLKARQFQEEVTRSEVARNEMKEKIKHAQEKLAKATEKIARVDQDEEKAVVAKKVNEEDLVRKKAEEETLRKQLEADLSEFKEELEEQEREFANATTQLDHMRRIKERAEAAKKAAQTSASDLLSEVAGQLGDKKP